MRWLTNCVLLATVAVLSATQNSESRPKRDLSLIKDLLSGNLFGNVEDPAPAVRAENTKIYKVQGLKGVVIKAVPKAKLKEELPEVDETVVLNSDPRIALASSYLGTKTLNDTLIALENIKRLLESGVLHTQEEIDKVVPPFLFDTSKIVVADGVKTPVSDFHTYKIPPLNENCCSEKKNFIITESEVPFYPLPEIHADRLPMHAYDMPEIAINPHTSLKVAHVQIPEEFGYNNMFLDGVISTYPVFTDTQNEAHNSPFLPTFVINRNDDVGTNPYRVNILESERVKDSSIYPLGHTFIPNHYFEQTIEEEKAGNLHVPSSYSYTSLHRDGTKTTYSNSDVVKHNSNYHTSGSNKNTNEKNVVAIQNIQKVQPLPSFIVNRIENAAATAHNFKLTTDKNTVVYVSPNYHNLCEPTADKVDVTIGSHVIDTAGYSEIPAKYSYTTVHKDGSITAHSNSGIVKHDTINVHKENKIYESNRDDNKEVVVVQAKNPTHLPSFITNRIENAAIAAINVKVPRPLVVEETVYVTPVPNYQIVHPVIPHTPSHIVTIDNSFGNHADYSKVSSQYSHTTDHKDGSQTTYTDSGLIKESDGKNRKDIEKIKGHYHEDVYCDDSSHLIDVPKQYHQVFHSEPSIVGLLYPTLSENNIVEQSHVQIPSTVTVTPLPYAENNVELQRVLLPKPIVSKYTYKQINHNMPDKFTVVQVGENPSYLENINDDQFINVTPNSVHVNTVSIPNYDYIPPITESHISSYKPIVNKNIKTVSGFTYKHVSNSGHHHKVDTESSKSDTPLLIQHKDDGLPTDILKTSSDNSLNANPIVVLPDEPTFSYKQERTDGSSVKIIGDSKKVVSIIQQSSTESSVQRGDIPEIVL